LKVSLHVGPHRTGTTYIQYAAFGNRAYLAGEGILFINQPAQSNRIPEALNRYRADIALAEFDRLAESCKGELGAAHPAPAMLYSSETFFAADARRPTEYQRSFSQFVAALQKRGHDVELVFVERNIEDLLTSNALLQASLGNLKFVTPDTAPYLDYLQGFTWKKSFYFDHFKVVHLSFDHLAAQGDLFANFMKLAFRLDLPGLKPIDPALDARNSASDAQIAKGLVMAPLINWLEQFGSVSRFELFNASQPLQTQVSGESWQAIVANIPLLRDCVRGTAGRAIEMFVESREAQRA
jgi:hypothetical protein